MRLVNVLIRNESLPYRIITSGTTDYQFRFIGLNLSYYKKRIPLDQLKLVLRFAGVYNNWSGVSELGE